MKKKAFMMILVIALSAGIMLTGCGNQAEESIEETETMQETQAETEETSPAEEESEETTEEVAAELPYAEKDGWNFCEELELQLPFVAELHDENGNLIEIPGVSIEKLDAVHKLTNVEEVASDKEGMKKILVDYTAEINYDVMLNEKEYVAGQDMNVGWLVSLFTFCDYYSGMSDAYTVEIGENESTLTGEWTWEWEDQVYPVSYEGKSVVYYATNGNPWESRGGNLFATNCVDSMEVSAVIEVPKDYDGLVLMIPKSGVQEYEKQENRTVEMKEALLDEDGNLKAQDEFYFYRVSDLLEKFAAQTETVDETAEISMETAEEEMAAEETAEQ